MEMYYWHSFLEHTFFSNQSQPTKDGWHTAVCRFMGMDAFDLATGQQLQYNDNKNSAKV